MIFHLKSVFLFLGVSIGRTVVNADGQFGPLPPTSSSWAEVVETAFPTWCIDAAENRLNDVATCADGTTNGRWTPLYFTKQHGGKDPAMGGYPTDLDTRYPFYYGSAFFGQACAGGNAHCSFDFPGDKIQCGSCGKIKTDNDDGPNGPGHVPPHIGLAAITRAYNDGVTEDIADWFDYAQNQCRIMPHVLLAMIRKYFPRDPVTGEASYPAPFSDAGGPDGPYPLEFVNLVGASCDAEKAKHPDWGNLDCYEEHSGGDVNSYPDYLEAGHGSPHYCSKGLMAAEVNKDWCPYLFFGPNRGKYRHPHVAYAAVEVWLANKVMPDKCGATWDDNNPDFPYNLDVAFPKMAAVEQDATANGDPEQPALECGHWVWPGTEGVKRKAVPGVFVTDKYLTSFTGDTPNVGCSSSSSSSSSRSKKGKGAKASPFRQPV